MRAKKQAEHAAMIDISFDESGIFIKSKGEQSFLEWKSIKKISKKPDMLIIYASSAHGFVLSKRVLTVHFESLYQYIQSKINEN